MNSEFPFEKVIDDYRMGRASYLQEVFIRIKEYANLNTNSKLLEIGAGPGTATESLKDYNIDVLEITDEQVDYLKKRYNNDKNINIFKSTFEDYQTNICYDLIYSANAFHWLDQNMAYYKVIDMLKEGGTFAIFWNLSFIKTNLYEVNILQQITKKYFSSFIGTYEENYPYSQAIKWIQYINKTGLFTEPHFFNIKWYESYDADRFLSWVKSLEVNCINLSPIDWNDYENEIKNYFAKYENKIEMPQNVILIMAKKMTDLKDNYIFVEKDNITSKIELEDLGRDSNIVEHHFFNYGDEVLYITQQDKLYGIITPRDLYLYNSGITKSKINRNFKCLQDVDYKNAERIFQSIPSIHEVAVEKDGKFYGVIKNGVKKTPFEWKKIRSEILKSPINMSNINGKRVSLSDLFKSMTQKEQQKLLEMKYNPDYVKLFTINALGGGVE